MPINGGFGFNPLGTGPFGRENWFHHVTYKNLPEKAIQQDQDAGAYYEKFILAVSPSANSLVEHGRMFGDLWDPDKVRLDLLQYFTASLGYDNDQEEAETFQRMKAAMWSRFLLVKGVAIAFVYLARLHGFEAEVKDLFLDCVGDYVDAIPPTLDELQGVMTGSPNPMLPWWGYDPYGTAIPGTGDEFAGQLACPPADPMVENVYDEILGVGDGIQTVFNGFLVETPVLYKSVHVEAGSVLGEEAVTGVISGTGITAGTVTHATGAISVTFDDPVPYGVQVKVGYSYRTTGQKVTFYNSSGGVLVDDGNGLLEGDGYGWIDYRTGKYMIWWSIGNVGDSVWASYQATEGGCCGVGCLACATHRIRLILTPGPLWNTINQNQLSITDAWARLLLKIKGIIPIHVTIEPIRLTGTWQVEVVALYDIIPADVQPTDTTKLRVYWT